MTKNKDKEGILKIEGKKATSHKGTRIGLSADFSAENWQSRREWHNIFKVIKGGKKYNPEYW